MDPTSQVDGGPSLLNSLQNLVLEHRVTCNELEALSGDFEAVLKELAAREDLRALLKGTAPADSLQFLASPLPPLGKDVEALVKTSREAVVRSRTLRLQAKRLRDGIAAKTGHVPKPDEHGGFVRDCHELSKRERQVLTLMVQGMSSKEIAAALGISFKTAVTHRASIMGKLDVHEIASVVREAIFRGLV